LTQKELFALLKKPPGGRLAKVLTELEQCGFVRSCRDFSKPKNGRYFQLVDFYTLFYYTHIKDRHLPAPGYWQSRSRKGAWHAWSGLTFEYLCAAHIEAIKRSLGISGVYTESSAWRSRSSSPGTQIDLVIDRDDGIIDLCEMKFTEKPFAIDADYDKALMNRREAFREETNTKKALHIVLVSASGLTEGSYRGMVQAVVTLDSLFVLE
jgi:hypothetical protein